jgi:ATP-binding cassette, subfamily F, member 3
VANGQVAPFDGDLDDYRRFVLSKSADRDSSNTNVKNAQSGKEGGAPRAGRSDLRRAAAEKRIELAPLRRRIATAETAVTRLTAEIAGIDARLAEPGLFARDPAKATALAKTRADQASALAKAEEEWLEASAEFDEKDRA